VSISPPGQSPALLARALPEYGPDQGKGDAMWRALSVARGDIVMFADADTRDFGGHFVYGTLGPLLMVPGVQFSKAACRRPFSSDEQSVADGGGRVTDSLVTGSRGQDLQDLLAVLFQLGVAHAVDPPQLIQRRRRRGRDEPQG
jgi:hypothetical protein